MKVDTQIFILLELKWKVGLENEKKNISYDRMTQKSILIDTKAETRTRAIHKGADSAAGPEVWLAAGKSLSIFKI